MNQLFKRHLLFTLSLSIASLPAAWAAPLEIWVSPDGDDDDAKGVKQAPYQTITHAKKMVETFFTQTDSPDEVVIYLSDGLYRIGSTLEFSSEIFNTNSPTVTFRAAPDAAPIISGAKQIKGWSLYDKKNNIYQADVGSDYSRQLYVNGNRATRARTELVDGHIPAGFLPKPILPTSKAPGDYIIDGHIEYIVANGVNPSQWADPAKWGNPAEVEAVIETQWKMMSVPVASIIPPAKGEQAGKIIMTQPAWTNANLYFGPEPNPKNTPKDQCKLGKPGIWSLWQVTRFENAYEFIDQAGEWYIDRSKQTIYYKAHANEVMSETTVELPIIETLVQGYGTETEPLANLRFEGITFAYAGWLAPSSNEGYVADQSGFLVTGSGNKPNITGHVKKVTRTPGNLSFENARHIVFKNNTFTHLGAVGLDFENGSHYNQIIGNRFIDISSAAIQLGDVIRTPLSDSNTTAKQPDYPSNNTISDNVIYNVGRDYVDTAGIFIGFSSYTDVSYNTISNVPWSGIAIGWGWGLLDESGFPGISCAEPHEWGNYPTTPNSYNKIRFNRISNFITNRWDGGAIYSTGQQGQSMDNPLIIEGNVAYNKDAESGGNVFYNDGGSRFINLIGNVSFNNPIGKINLGPAPRSNNPLPYPDPIPGVSANLINLVPYGGQIGGCRTYGDILYQGNFWQLNWKSIGDEFIMDLISDLMDDLSHPKPPIQLYSKDGFFDICPFEYEGKSHPNNLTYSDNVYILGEFDVPKEVLNKAGSRGQ